MLCNLNMVLLMVQSPCFSTDGIEIRCVTNNSFLAHRRYQAIGEVPHLLIRHARGQSIEFGAQQCEFKHPEPVHVFIIFSGILVRDENAKLRLREQVGDIGIIM